MTKGFENGRIVPISSKRLRSVGSLERHAPDETRVRDAKIYPILRGGAMLTTQNWKVYLDNKRNAWAIEMQAKAKEQLEYIRQRRASVTGVTNNEEQ